MRQGLIRIALVTAPLAAALWIILARPDILSALSGRESARLAVRALVGASWCAPLLVALAAAHHRRGRLALSAVTLAACGLLLSRAGPLAVPDPALAARLLALLVPGILSIVPRLEERGPLTAAGARRLAAVGAVLALAALAASRWRGTAAPVVDALWGLAPRSALAPAGVLPLGLGLAALVSCLAPRGPERAHVGAALAAALASVEVALAGASGAVPRLDAPLAAPVALLAGSVGLALALYLLAWRHAHLDALTGLPGRRALDERLPGLRGRYVLAVLDLDRFKRVNDRHGHEAGDAVLREVARVLRRFRAGQVYRSGGEEFVAAFPGADRERLEPELDRLRREVAALRIPLPGGARTPIRVTVSIGAAERSTRCPSPRAVLEAADQALLRAKRKGRDRIEWERRARGERARRRRGAGGRHRG